MPLYRVKTTLCGTTAGRAVPARCAGVLGVWSAKAVLNCAKNVSLMFHRHLHNFEVKFCRVSQMWGFSIMPIPYLGMISMEDEQNVW